MAKTPGVFVSLCLVGCVLLWACDGPPKRSSFVVGCDLPWLDGHMGWDMADHAEWGVGFNAENTTAYFADMQRMGISVVRWWLFADCRAGIVFDASGQPTGIQPEVFDRLDFVMDELCPKYGIRMYWCLLSGLLDTPHSGIVTDPKKRRAYIDNVVMPLAERYGDHPSLFAFDLMNEPESDVAARSGNWKRVGTNWTTMREFLSECAAAIHAVAPEARVSAGSGWHGFENLQSGLYAGLGLDFYDAHIYTDDPAPPPVGSLALDLPCLIGEYNVTRETAADPKLQAELVAQFLAGAEAGGYMGALVWSYGHAETASPYGLLQANGRWKPVAKVIRRRARR